MKTIGVLTGGGDCPGLNAVIRAVERAGKKYDFETLGIRNGWQGLIDGDVEPLTDFSVSGILPKGGTILGTSRTDPLKNISDFQKIKANIKKYGIYALIVIGGDGTLSAARDIAKQGIPVVGIPKTIDNDISGTDMTFGFDTAVATVTEAIDRLHTTAESHHRIIVVEVMGRNVGWIAVTAGIAGGADEILIPEVHFTLDGVCKKLKARYDAGKKFSIVVIAEGAHAKDLGVTPFLRMNWMNAVMRSLWVLATSWVKNLNAGWVLKHALPFSAMSSGVDHQRHLTGFLQPVSVLPQSSSCMPVISG